MAVQPILPTDGSSATALDHYRRQLGLPSTDAALETLARAVSIAPIAGRPRRLIVRPGPRPSLAVEGIFDEADSNAIAAHGRAAVHACSTLRYVRTGEARALAVDLGRKLVARFGPEAVCAFDYEGIPHGGRRVREMLAAELGLVSQARAARSDPSKAPLVLVDDCALTGARLGRWLGSFPDRRVIVALLLSHPALRAALGRNEPRVVACLAAGDLCGVGADSPSFVHAASKALPRYWVGLTEHVAFPWNETDRGVWNAAPGRVERAWNILPPELCAKNARPGTTALAIEREEAVPASRTRGIGPRPSRRRYKLFGRIVESDFPHGVPLPETGPTPSAPPDLRITVEPVGQQAVGHQERCTPVYVSPYREPSGAPRLVASDTPRGDLLRFASGADFLVQDHRIAVTMRDGFDVRLAEINLLGVVLAWWLERRGVLVFHGSGVAVDGAGIGFLGMEGAGKSVAAGLLVRSGATLVTDDALALEIRPGGVPMALPSHGSLRLWPRAAELMGIAPESLPPVHPDLAKRRLDTEVHGLGRFVPEPAPLRALFLLERAAEGAPAPTVPDVPAGPAVLELVRHSFLARKLTNPSAQARRLPALAGVAAAVPMKKLLLPTPGEEVGSETDSRRRGAGAGAALFEALSLAGMAPESLPNLPAGAFRVSRVGHRGRSPVGTR